MALKAHRRYGPEQKQTLLETLERARGHTGQSATELLPRLGLPPATYYRWKERSKDERLEDQVVVPRRLALGATPDEEAAVCAFALQHPAMGYKRLAYLMIDRDIASLPPWQVYRVLGKHDLLARRPSSPSLAHKRPPEPDHPNQVWHIDLMYLYIEPRWYYLVDILDAYSRYLVHWTLNTTMLTDTVTLTLQQAVDRLASEGFERKGHEPHIVHDRGSQFLSQEWRTLVSATGLLDIKTRVAHPQSNGRLERLHRTHREEGLIGEDLQDYHRTLQALASWSRYYNHERPHSALHYLCPVDYYRGDPDSRLAERQRKIAQATAARKVFWTTQAH